MRTATLNGINFKEIRPGVFMETTREGLTRDELLLKACEEKDVNVADTYVEIANTLDATLITFPDLVDIIVN